MFKIHLLAARAAGFTVGLVLATVSASAQVVASPRVDHSIDSDWRFIREDVLEAAKPSFDDSTWQAVNLPHTWIQETHDDRSTYYAGPCWYRHHLQIDSSLAGKRLFLRFGAASRDSEIYVNGKRAGTHRGAFGAFCVPITDLVHVGDNILAIRVDNAGDPDVAPLSGDFTTYGGLHRSAHLLALDPVHITPLDDAGPGVYAVATLNPSDAALKVTCKLRNDGAEAAEVGTDVVVRDAGGQVVASANAVHHLAAATNVDALIQLSVPQPHRWDGRSDPYLYQLTVELSHGGHVVDQVVQALGLRTFSVDRDHGLTLNGHPYDFHGVNYHQGRPAVGFASTPEMQAEDNQLMCEMGCTGVRMAHYQHDENEYALCDKSGLIVWAELALVNRMNDTSAFRENIRQQLRELIKQNYNHPSVFFWSMYNEVWVSSDGKANTEEQWKLVKELVDLAHELDAARLTTGAGVAGVTGPVSTYMDLTAQNRYDGWYDASPETWPGTVDKIRKTFPERCVGVAEYGAGASILQHSNPTTRPTPASKWHPEEWQCIVHEHAWDALQQQPWLWCKLVWCMFDFGSVGRNEGDTPGINDKGMVTADRKTRKDVFYFYKACWTKKPFVYLTERRFNPRPAGSVELKVYSNCDSVELKVNGRSMGRKSEANHVFRWPDVLLSEGQAAIEVVGDDAGQPVSETLVWKINAASN